VDVEVEAARTGTAALEAADRPEFADLVVLLALGLVAQHVVRRADLFESLLGGIVAGMRVGVVGARQLAVRLGDVFRGRVVADAEDLVVVLLVPLALSSHWRITSSLSRGP